MKLKSICCGLLALSLLAASCSSQPKTSTPGQALGAVITSDGAISHAELVPKMEGVDSLAVKLAGEVTAVCKKKGCWMMLKTAGGEDMRVTFKDYGFFMPMDIVGKKVVMDGFAYVDVTPVDMLRHYAEDDGKSKEEIEKITEPKRELSYEANGVIILN